MKVVTFLLAILFITSNLFPDPGITIYKNIEAVRTNERITIDGVLSESVWKRVGFSELLQNEPKQGAEPSFKSEAWVAYDDDALYFAAKYSDSNPDSIFARLARRDFLWPDPSDGCVLYLDSYDDNRSGYFFFVSAAGTLADGLLENDEQPEDLTWDAVWEGVPHMDKDGWSVEMKIPFSQLRFREDENQTWGINIERYVSRYAESDMAAYTPRNESGFVSRFLNLIGLKSINPSNGVELLPYVIGKAEFIGGDANNPFNNGKKYIPGAGLDLKANLSNSILLNATINPDFGQVEVDPAIVNLTDVEYSFTEKRPFFTEGVSIFRFGRGGSTNFSNFNWSNPNIFYSRRIGRTPQGSLPAYDYADAPSGTHILGAGKITGQLENGWKIGTILAATKSEYAKIEANSEKSDIEIEPLTYYGVFRAQKDFNSTAQGFGILSTVTKRMFNDNDLEESINKEAYVIGIDGWTFLDSDRTYVLTGWSALSHVTGTNERITSLQRSATHYFQRPDATHISVDSSATSLTGYSGRFVLNKNRGDFQLNAAFGFTSPSFEINDLGYGSYSDLMNGHFFAQYNFTKPTEYYQSTGVGAAIFRSYDFGMNNTSMGYFTNGYWNTKDLYGADFSFIYSPQTTNARRTRGGPLTLNPITRSLNLNFYTDNRQWWVLNAGVSLDRSENLNSSEVFADIEIKALPTLTVTLGPDYVADNYNAQWITSYSDISATETFNRRYIFANLKQSTFSANIRADWILTPRLSVQLYLQPYISSGSYNNFKYLERSKSYDFVTYGSKGSTVTKETMDDGSSYFKLDTDGAGTSQAKIVWNPDFNYISLRGNAVLRWEYMPGSALYLVWTQSREEVEPSGEFELGRSMNRIMAIRPDNIFMVKLTYWL